MVARSEVKRVSRNLQTEQQAQAFRTHALQAAAREIYTLRQVEPLVEESFAGPKGMVESAPTAAVEQHLHEEAYQEAELEGLLGVQLDDLFAGNSSQLRSVAFARNNGERAHPENNCAQLEGESIMTAPISFCKTCGPLQLQQVVLLFIPFLSHLHAECITVIFIVSLHEIEGSGLLQAASSCDSGRCTCLQRRCGCPSSATPAIRRAPRTKSWRGWAS